MPLVYLGFPGSSAVEESACNAGDPGSIPGREDPLEKDRLPTPVFLPGESHERRSPAGCSPWSCIESDVTERVSTAPVYSWALCV